MRHFDWQRKAKRDRCTHWGRLIYNWTCKHLQTTVIFYNCMNNSALTCAHRPVRSYVKLGTKQLSLIHCTTGSGHAVCHWWCFVLPCFEVLHQSKHYKGGVKGTFCHGSAEQKESVPTARTLCCKLSTQLLFMTWRVNKVNCLCSYTILPLENTQTQLN